METFCVNVEAVTDLSLTWIIKLLDLSEPVVNLFEFKYSFNSSNASHFKFEHNLSVINNLKVINLRFRLFFTLMRVRAFLSIHLPPHRIVLRASIFLAESSTEVQNYINSVDYQRSMEIND